MLKFANWKIGTKLYATFLGVILIFVALIGYSTHAMIRLHDLQEVVSGRLNDVQEIKDIAIRAESVYAVAGDRTALLRGLAQQHTWLALGLVGLHSLQERSASLREAIFGWRPIPVGLMDQDAFADLLQIEENAFPLEYGLDAIDRAYQLTGGQPFLGLATAEIFIDFHVVLVEFIRVLRNLPPVGREVTLVERA